MGPALEIFRKLRDSLDNEDVYCNIAHCLLEMHENAKAVETYEYTLKRFSNAQNRSRLLNLLGKAWYSRGVREKSYEFFQKALKNAEMALKCEEDNKSSERTIASFQYNVALLHFQIAETLRRATFKQRKVVYITDAISGLQSGLDILKELQKSKNFNIIPEEELEQRIQLGETTMKSALERIAKEQEEFELEQSNKLDEARKILEENEIERQEKQKKEEEIRQMKLEKQKEEYRKLQDEAQRLIQERESMITAEDEKDELSENEAENGEDGKKTKKKRKAKKPAGEKKRRRKDEPAEPPKKEEEDDEEDANVQSGRRNKKNALSNEFIDDSDEEEAVPSGEDENDLF